MAQFFARHFQYNIDIVPDRLSLTKIENKPNESFREYGLRWREQAARVNPPMEEDEMVKYFLQAQEPTYFGHLISAMGKPFNDVVKIGEMVEEGLKSSKIMSYSAIRATTQAIQNGTRSLLGSKKKDDVAMVVSGPWRGLRGHDIEKCWHLKREIQGLIDANQIVVHIPDAPNINQNPLPAHTETHMIEIVCKDGESGNFSESIMMIRSSEGNSVKVLDSTKAIPSTVEGMAVKLSMLNVKPPVLVVKGPSNDIGVVPWNYKQVIVTYKGKEVEEEVNETRGLTHSGRCFTMKELRKAKHFKDSQMPVKKPVTEEEVEVFLKKMNVQDYSIMEVLRKTLAQISHMSLLIHSDDHCKALMKILNEAHVPDKIIVNHLEKNSNKIFEANRITFLDDELPMEGTEHN
ncbi:uncharacterized protein [Nicotiana tomentosiformis]|uniref:uncharacterized protein n=1 Tax=Nicotiana tomentosiformis TaxID=4098 RepID=UPI00388C4596